MVKKQLTYARRLLTILVVAILLSSLIALMFPPKYSAAITYVSNASATSNGTVVSSQTVTAPSGMVSGEIEIAEVATFKAGSPGLTVTAPSGWSIIGAQINAGKYYLNDYYHLTTSTEPTSYTWSYSSAVDNIISISVYSGENSTSPIDSQASQSNASSTTQAIPSTSTSYNGDVVIPLVSYEGSATAATYTSGLNQIITTSTPNVGLFAAYEVLNNAGSTGTFQTTTSAAVASLVQTVAVAPSGGVAGIQYVGTDTPANCGNNGCTSLSTASPTGWSAGNLFIASVNWDTNTDTLTPPSGWTQINSTSNNGGYALADFYHFALSTDPSSFSWTFSGSTQAIATISDYSGVDSTSPLDVNGLGVDSANTTSHTAPTLTTNYPDDMLVAIWSYEAATTTSSFPTSMAVDWNTSDSGPHSDIGTSAAHVLIGTAGSTGTNTAVSGKSTVSIMHSITLRANLPLPLLIAPINGSVDLILGLSFQLVNESLNSTPLEYKIQLCTTSACSTVLQTFDETASQTGWSGQNANSGTAYVGSTTYSGSTTATYTVQTPLSAGTQYWWRGFSFDTGDSLWSLPSNADDFTTSYIPAAPTLYSPPAGATNIPSKPEFHLAATDQDSNPLEYKIQVCADSACSNVLSTWDETVSQSGWSGQDSNNSTAYASSSTSASNSTLAYFDYINSQLTPGTTYYWRAYAINPTGSNIFSAASVINAFTINNSETRILNGTIDNGTIL